MFNLLSKRTAGRLLQEAAAEATLLTERHDIPHVINGVPVPADLDDTNPRWWQTRSGHRIAGRLLPNDLAGGGPSPATPLLIGLLPLLAMASLLLSHIGGFFIPLCVLLMLVVALALWSAEGWKTAIGSLFVGALLPLGAATSSLGGHGSAVLSPVSGLMGMASSPMTLLPILGGALVVGMLLAGSVSRALLAARVVIGTAAALAALAFVSSLLRGAVGPTASVLPWFAVGAGLPWLWAQLDQRAWAMRLAAQDIQAPGETSLGSFDTHTEARQQQAEAALRDKSPLITIGKASGAFAGKMDGFAPDAGKRVCLSVSDLTEHLAFAGSTGTGKSSALRSIIAQWVEADAGGMFVLDEKNLPGELRGLKGYILIEPGTRFGLLENLSPTEATTAIFSVGEGDQAKGGNGSSAFFASASRTMFLHACVLTQALIEVERAQLTERGLEGDELEAARSVRWTVAGIRDTLGLALGEQSRDVVLTHVQDHQPADEGLRYMLDAAREYWGTTVPTMDAEVRSNVRETLFQKIDPLTSHPGLVLFAHVERSEGFDLAAIKHAGKFGVNLPKAMFGVGGLLVSALVKERVFSIMRSRGTYDWKAAGEKWVLGVVDEAASIVSAEDAAFLKVARSYGFCAVYAVQNFDAYAAKLGSEALTQAFLDNFRSKVSLSSTDYTYQQMAKHLGTTRRLKWAGGNTAVNYTRSLDVLAHSALVDTTHPAHAHLRTLLRGGAGLFKEVGDGLGKGRDKDLLKISPVEGATMDSVPLLEPADWDAHLAKKFRAVATVQRAGVRRRDVIDLEKMFAFPADLLEAQPAPDAQATAATATRPPLPDGAAGSRGQVAKVAPLAGLAPALDTPAEPVKPSPSLDVPTSKPSASPMKV